MLASLIVLTAFAATPVDIEAPAGVTHVALVCPGRAPLVAEVQGGHATFAEVPPDACEVQLVRGVGGLQGAGRYRCDDAGCVRLEAHHAPISDAPGRVNIVLEPPYEVRWLELTCGEDFRERVDLVENTGVFSKVPPGECTLHFKGGPPARYRPITAGSWRCSLVSSTAICRELKP